MPMHQQNQMWIEKRTETLTTTKFWFKTQLFILYLRYQPKKKKSLSQLLVQIWNEQLYCLELNWETYEDAVLGGNISRTALSKSETLVVMLDVTLCCESLRLFIGCQRYNCFWSNCTVSLEVPASCHNLWCWKMDATYFMYSNVLWLISSRNETKPMTLVKPLPSTSCSSIR